MFRPENLLQDPERFPFERFGFGVFAHTLVQRAQVIKAKRRIGMFRPENFLPDPKGFLIERLGFSILAHRPIESRPGY